MHDSRNVWIRGDDVERLLALQLGLRGGETAKVDGAGAAKFQRDYRIPAHELLRLRLRRSVGRLRRSHSIHIVSLEFGGGLSVRARPVFLFEFLRTTRFFLFDDEEKEIDAIRITKGSKSLFPPSPFHDIQGHVCADEVSTTRFQFQLKKRMKTNDNRTRTSWFETNSSGRVLSRFAGDLARGVH